MIFLLFLASLGVVEYLLRDVGCSPGGAVDAREAEKIADHKLTPSHETSTSDLLSLGQALGSGTPMHSTDYCNQESAQPPPHK